MHNPAHPGEVLREYLPEGVSIGEVAKRLGVTLNHFGVDLDSSEAPTTDELLAIAARHAPIAFDDLKAAERGVRHGQLNLVMVDITAAHSHGSGQSHVHVRPQH